MSEPAIRPIEAADRDRAIAALTMAFGADPMARWLFPDAADYLQNFSFFARAFGGAAFEHESAFASEGFGGAALWLPPGAHADGDAIEGFFRENFGERKQSEIFEILGKMGQLHIVEPHWYLAIIGVDPVKQGRGIGAALLRHSLDRCDEQHSPAYLESSNEANLTLYMRHGFEVIGEVQVGSSPTIYPMLRSPR